MTAEHVAFLAAAECMVLSWERIFSGESERGLITRPEATYRVGCVAMVAHDAALGAFTELTGQAVQATYLAAQQAAHDFILEKGWADQIDWIIGRADGAMN